MTVDDRRRSWLRHWHDVIDAETGLDSSFDFESAYDDPYSDYRMHFVTWDLSDDALHRCFEALPAGQQMAERAIEMRCLSRTRKPQLSEESAVDLFEIGLDAYSKFSDDRGLKKPIRVRYVSSAEFSAAAMNTDRVAVLLETIDWQIPTENSGVSSFLRETLYRLAHSYDVVDHIDWPLIHDPQSLDPYRSFARLGVTDNYWPLLDKDGPVLFVTTDRTG